MFIASLFTAILSSTSAMFSASPKYFVQTPTALSLQNIIHALEADKKTKRSERAAHSTINRTNYQIKLANDELLFERCHHMPGISSLIASFLLPCRIPALQLHLSDIFVRKGCPECASRLHRPYLSVTCQGEVIKNRHHYNKMISGIACRDGDYTAIDSPLECDQLVTIKSLKYAHDGRIMCDNYRRKKHPPLHKTYLYNNPSSNFFEITLNKRIYTKQSDVSWYQQCCNPDANYDFNKKHDCKHHFIMALAPSMGGTSQLFVWSARGNFHGQYTIPPRLTLLAYKNPVLESNSIYSAVGIDGFLWWMNTQNGSLMRLDKRGVWDTIPGTISPERVWYSISPNSQWIVERLTTEGTQTTFSRTSCANAMLQTSPSTLPIQKQATLWNVTTALWLNTLFEDINHSQSTINMEPRWIVRYRNLRDWLTPQNITLIKGLQARIGAQAAVWVMNRDQEALKSRVPNKKKRKHWQKACK